MSDAAEIVREISKNLEAVFRHIVPGVLIMVAGAVSHPNWPCWSSAGSAHGVVLLAVVAVAVGNAWYVLNRYGFHQLIDMLLYWWKCVGPAMKGSFRYHDELGVWVRDALDPKHDDRARHHVAFRAASVFLIYTVGWLVLLMGLSHSPGSVIAPYGGQLVLAGIAILVLGGWQNIITRRIDAVLLHGHNPLA